MALYAVETSSKDAWGAVFETLRVKRDLEQEMNRNRSHERHLTGFIHRKCRGGKVTQFWSVCHDCHEFLSMGTVKKSKVPNWQDLPLMSIAEVEKWRDGSVVNTRANRISEWHHREWWRTYDNYLKSAEWVNKRKLVMERDNGTCRRCSSKAEHVHHLTYERVGDEAMSDLVAVCAGCHKWIHSEGRDWNPLEDVHTKEHDKLQWLIEYIEMGSTPFRRVFNGKMQWSLGEEGDRVMYYSLSEAVDAEIIRQNWGHVGGR